MENYRKKSKAKGKTTRAALGVLICFFAAVFVFSLYNIITVLSEYKKADDVYNDLRESFVSVNRTPSDSIQNIQSPESSSSAHSDKSPEDVGMAGESPISVDFDALLAYNPDVVGWLYCEGTEMNYPVVQTYDNDYYLRRDLKGNYLVTGTIFADFRCAKPGSDVNYLIYGHDMDNGTIFGMLKNYASEEYYDAHPVLYFYTPEADYRIEVYTGVVVDATDDIYRIGSEGEDFTDYVKTLASRSGLTPAFEITEEDRLITLSTCSDQYEDARFILIGRVVEIAAEDIHE